MRTPFGRLAGRPRLRGVLLAVALIAGVVAVDTTTPAPADASSSQTSWPVTVGTSRKTAMDTSSEANSGTSHGTRFYCTVSHYSHDDPIVYPGQTGAAHAHLFWGNTGTDAYSDGPALKQTGNSTCEGGVNNRSAYWAPAVFNDRQEVLLPEAVFNYYKSFFGGRVSDRTTIRPIPTGLEMLATREVRGASDNFFRIKEGPTAFGNLQFKVQFPQCLAVDPGGRPVLSSADGTSHLSYANDYNRPSNCPASHPYRIPQLTTVMNYRIPDGSSWRLSSDMTGDAPGATLHADYIAAWDTVMMNDIVDCNIRELRNCRPLGGGRQLPERFFSPEGVKLYDSSIKLLASTDRTPFGTDIQPHAGQPTVDPDPPCEPHG